MATTIINEVDPVEEKLTAAIELMEKTCSTKRPSDPFYQPAWDMSGAHGLFFIGLRNIYKISPSIAKKDERDFVEYALFWVAGLTSHHDWEEDWYMDSFKGAVSVPQIKEEHSTFMPKVGAVRDYLTSCLPKGATWGPWKVVVEEDKKEDFSAEKLRTIISELVLDGALIKHLSEEITYLDPAKFRSSGVTDADMKKTNEKTAAYYKTMPPSFAVWGIQHTPKGDFPAMPWFVKNIIMKRLLYWPGRRIYRFSPGPA